MIIETNLGMVFRNFWIKNYSFVNSQPRRVFNFMPANNSRIFSQKKGEKLVEFTVEMFFFPKLFLGWLIFLKKIFIYLFLSFFSMKLDLNYPKWLPNMGLATGQPPLWSHQQHYLSIFLLLSHLSTRFKYNNKLFTTYCTHHHLLRHMKTRCKILVH